MLFLKSVFLLTFAAAHNHADSDSFEREPRMVVADATAVTDEILNEALAEGMMDELEEALADGLMDEIINEAIAEGLMNEDSMDGLIDEMLGVESMEGLEEILETMEGMEDVTEMEPVDVTEMEPPVDVEIQTEEEIEMLEVMNVAMNNVEEDMEIVMAMEMDIERGFPLSDLEDLLNLKFDLLLLKAEIMKTPAHIFQPHWLDAKLKALITYKIELLKLQDMLIHDQKFKKVQDITDSLIDLLEMIIHLIKEKKEYHQKIELKFDHFGHPEFTWKTVLKLYSELSDLKHKLNTHNFHEVHLKYQLKHLVEFKIALLKLKFILVIKPHVFEHASIFKLVELVDLISDLIQKYEKWMPMRKIMLHFDHEGHPEFDYYDLVDLQHYMENFLKKLLKLDHHSFKNGKFLYDIKDLVKLTHAVLKVKLLLMKDPHVLGNHPLFDTEHLVDLLFKLVKLLKKLSTPSTEYHHYEDGLCTANHLPSKPPLHGLYPVNKDDVKAWYYGVPFGGRHTVQPDYTAEECKAVCDKLREHGWPCKYVSSNHESHDKAHPSCFVHKDCEHRLPAHGWTIYGPHRPEPHTPMPTPMPTPEWTDEPTPMPTNEPTPMPTNEPTPMPTNEPTPMPTNEPTPMPTNEPTPMPTNEPTPMPTNEPTPMRPTGQCSHELKGDIRRLFHIREDAFECKKTCHGRESCITKCVQKETHLSFHCSECFGKFGRCVAKKCFVTCLLKGEEKCNECANDRCWEDLETCAFGKHHRRRLPFENSALANLQL